MSQCSLSASSANQQAVATGRAGQRRFFPALLQGKHAMWQQLVHFSMHTASQQYMTAGAALSKEVARNHWPTAQVLRHTSHGPRCLDCCRRSRVDNPSKCSRFGCDLLRCLFLLQWLEAVAGGRHPASVHVALTATQRGRSFITSPDAVGKSVPESMFLDDLFATVSKIIGLRAVRRSGTDDIEVGTRIIVEVLREIRFSAVVCPWAWPCSTLLCPYVEIDCIIFLALHCCEIAVRNQWPAA